MSFLQAFIKQKKSGSYGKKPWTRRTDNANTEEPEPQKQEDVCHKKRDIKDAEKTQEHSYEHSHKHWGDPPLSNEQAQDHSENKQGTLGNKEKEISNSDKRSPEIGSEEESKNQSQNNKNNDNTSKESPTQNKDSSQTSVPNNEEQKKFTPEEMVGIRNRLRKLKHPIRLFDESDSEAFHRLCAIEQGDPTAAPKVSGAKATAWLPDLQQPLKDKLQNKKPINLEIGGEKAEDVIGLRTTKNGSHLDYSKFEKECKSIPRQTKWTLILKWIK